MSSYSIYPFLPANSTSPPQVFPYDVVINEAYPGIQFIPTEANGLYQEIREVLGAWWFVTNATWNENLLQWDQESNQNTGLPAYALELAHDGTMVRYFAVATNIPLTPITWNSVFTVDRNGSVIITPPIYTASGDPTEQINPVWDAGISAFMVARNVAVTDTASSSSSVLDNLAVNGTSVWTVDKFGILQVGTIPVARISGLTPFPGFNNVTLTGNTTMTGPAHMESTLQVDGATTIGTNISPTSFTVNGTGFFTQNVNASGGLTVSTGATVTGGETVDTLTFSSGGQAVNGPTVTTGSVVIPAVLSAVTVPIRFSNFFPEGTTVLIAGSGSSFSGSVTSGTTTSITVDCLEVITGVSGNTIASGATVSYTTAYALTSSDSSINISNIGTPATPIADLVIGVGYFAVGATVFAYGGSGTSLTIPSVGSVWNVVSFQAVIMSSSTGTLTVTGTGGTDGGSWAGGTDSIVNPAQTQAILQLNGLVHAGDALTATVSGSGGITITTVNMQILATRVS